MYVCLHCTTPIEYSLCHPRLWPAWTRRYRFDYLLTLCSRMEGFVTLAALNQDCLAVGVLAD